MGDVVEEEEEFRVLVEKFREPKTLEMAVPRHGFERRSFIAERQLIAERIKQKCLGFKTFLILF